MNKNNIWHRGVITYLQIKGLAPKEIQADMAAALGDDVPALSIFVRENAYAFG